MPEQIEGFWGRVHANVGNHYSIFECVDEELSIEALHQIFIKGEADSLNLILFSTSGIHGSYCTIEERETWDIEEQGCEAPPITFVIVQPRICCLRYGNCLPETPEEYVFLKRLRQSSWNAINQIGNRQRKIE